MQKQIRRYLPYLAASVFFYALSAVAETGFAILMGDLTDAAVNTQFSLMMRSFYAILAVLAGDLALQWLALQLRCRHAKRCMLTIRQKLMQGIYRKRTTEENAALLNLLSSDMDRIEENYLLPQALICFDAAEFLFSVAALLLINWKATCFFALLFLIPIVVPQLYAGVLQKNARERSEGDERYTFAIKEQIQGMSDILWNLSVPAFLRKFRESCEMQQEARRRYHFSQRYVGTLSLVCGIAAQAGCMAIGGVFVIRGELSIGELIASVQLLNNVFQPVSDLSGNLSLVRSTKPLAEKLCGYFDAEEDCGGEPLEGSMEIAYRNVSVAYDGRTVIRGFDRVFREGGTYAVVGDSGSGKSSLIRCLLQEKRDYEGNILLGGRDVADIPAPALFATIGYVPQDAYIFNDTLVNNITMGRDYPEERLRGVIGKVGLGELSEHHTERIGDHGSSLSGGERQRLAIARALIRSPRILIFDEPTSALDPGARDQINELILSLDGYTRIVITHDRREEYLAAFDETIHIAS